MFVKNKEMFLVKRFLHLHKGIVMPFDKRGIHPELNIDNYLIHKALKTLTSKMYLTKFGNWQHAWYFLTEEGNKNLKEEVGLPEEFEDVVEPIELNKY